MQWVVAPVLGSSGPFFLAAESQVRVAWGGGALRMGWE